MTQDDWNTHKLLIMNEIESLKDHCSGCDKKVLELQLEQRALTTRIRIYITVAAVILSPIWGYAVTMLLKMWFNH